MAGATTQMNAQGAKDDMYQVSPTPERLKKGEKVLIITAKDTEDLEFFYPYYRLTEERYQVDVATLEGGAFEGKHGLGLKQTRRIADMKAQDYALLYIPGGKAPAALREDESVLALVKEFGKAGTPIAAICHGAQVLISAELVKGKQIACAPDVRSELEQAGGTFVDEALVEDGQFVTGRKPGDLHRHLYGVLDYLQGREGSQKGRREQAA